jgi:beta-lactamase regulating signal transducer with metallopeptidase domain
VAWWILQNLLVTTVLAAVVALVCRFGRVGPVARHAVWVLVLVKFVTPPIVEWPWAVPDVLGVHVADTPLVYQSGASGARLEIDNAPLADGPAAPSKSGIAAATWSSGPAAPRMDTVLWPWLIGAWATGSGVLLLIEGFRLARLARAVRAAAPADEAIVHRVRVLSAELGLRRVPVLGMTGLSSPAVWCLGRPRLLWPAELPADSSDACIDGLIVHELAHVTRRDHVVGWIELVASVIWWWNPFFWLVRSALREQAELACDAWVISALPNGRRAYAESLLALSAAIVQGWTPPAGAAVIGIGARSRRVLERRLVMIMKGRSSRRLSFVGLVGLAILAGATLPVWAIAPQQAPPPPVPVVEPQVPSPRAPAPSVVAPHQVPAPPAPVAHVPPTAVPHVAPASSVSHMPAPAAQQVPPPPPPPPPPTPTPAKPSTARPAPMPAPPTPPTPAGAAPSRTVVRRPDSQTYTVVATPQSASVRGYVYRFAHTPLPAEGEALLKSFETDRDAIQKEADKKIEARRAEMEKALKALQDQFAKDGKLDEAVAIRDYLRAMASGARPGTVIRRQSR